MNSRTKHILIVALGAFTGGIVALGFLLYNINTGGAQLETYVNALSEKRSQEEAFIRVRRLVDETASDRDLLASAFFTDEGDSISFLGEIERFAASIQLNLKTQDLNIKTAADNKTEHVTMTFLYSGDKSKVDTFTAYLETIPYHSTVEDLTLERSSSGIWQGTLTLTVTITPS
jgi:hypothetical protein